MLLNEEMDINEMLIKSNFNKLLFISGALPYKLDINTDFYEFELCVNLDGYQNEDKIKRKISFTISQHLVDDQDVPGINNVLSYNPIKKKYTIISSRFKLCIELTDDEYDSLKNDDQELDKKVKMLYQTILAFLANKYAMTMNGNDIVNLCIEHCGLGRLFIFEYDANNHKIIDQKGLIVPSLTLDNNFKSEVRNFKDVLSENDIVWLYFLNNAIFYYNHCDFLNSIIYSAISLESYLNYLIKENRHIVKFENYNKKLKELQKIPGFFTTIKYLKENDIINSTESKELKSCYGSIKEMRNSVMHGKLDKILMNKSSVEEGLRKLVEFYNQHENKYFKLI